MSIVSSSNRFDAAIFVTITLVLLALFVLLASNLFLQFLNYKAAITVALDNPKVIDYASVLSYSRAWDFAVVKTSALFLSFLLIFSGALYVLRAGETNFELTAKNADFKGSLSLNYVLSTKSLVEYGDRGLQLDHEMYMKQTLAPIEPSSRRSE